jgi:hypothetical protein
MRPLTSGAKAEPQASTAKLRRELQLSIILFNNSRMVAIIDGNNPLCKLTFDSIYVLP